MKPIRFGIIGEYGSGKSLLVNCLLQRPIATIGVGDPTTHTIVNYIYSTKEHVVYHSDSGIHRALPIEMLHDLDTKKDILEIDVYLSCEILKNYTLTDMPGFGANEEDNIVARTTIHEIDFAILLAWNNKVMGASSQSFHEIMMLKTLNIPYYFILNCTNTDRWRCDDEDNIHIAENDLSLLDFYKPTCYPLEGNGINIVNLMLYWYSICDIDDVLIKRRKNVSAIKEYVNTYDKSEVGAFSNFDLIKKIFDMENNVYLELRREIKNEIKRLKDEVCPIGTIQAFAYNSIPDGWLLCDGHHELVDEFPDLFHMIGSVYGGDGKKDFCVPDLRGRFIRGWDNSGDFDDDKNRVFGSSQEDSLQNHYHTFYMESKKTKKDGSHDHYVGYETLYFGTNTFSDDDPCQSLKGCSDPHEVTYGDSTRAIHEHELPKMEVREVCGNKQVKVNVSRETRPKNIALLYCIKAK